MIRDSIVSTNNLSLDFPDTYCICRLMNTQPSLTNWASEWGRGWDQFWFTPAAPHTLALIRILTGLMLFYTHLVWTVDLEAFLGVHSWISTETSQFLQQGSYKWSYLWYIDSPVLLWTTHLAGLVIFIMLTLGMYTRVVSVLSWFIALSYCHRLEGALFGLDQINVLLLMYLMISPAGRVYSIDHWLAKRSNAGKDVRPLSSISTSIATRLIQLHLCVIYLFGGIGKMRGLAWWDGSASWLALANPEYQTVNMTWLASHPLILAAITHVTVFWETFYCLLIWPRLTRPLVLSLALIVHVGIALVLGMFTFGCVMLIANLSFISPQVTDRSLPRLWRGRGGGES